VGFAPATAILGKPKELPKERGAVSPLAFGEERASLTSRNSRRKADERALEGR